MRHLDWEKGFEPSTLCVGSIIPCALWLRLGAFVDNEGTSEGCQGNRSSDGGGGLSGVGVIAFGFGSGGFGFGGGGFGFGGGGGGFGGGGGGFGSGDFCFGGGGFCFGGEGGGCDGRRGRPLVRRRLFRWLAWRCLSQT